MSVQVTFYGHACVRIAGPDGSVLIDPFMDGNPLCPISPDKVECDAIGVTHGHHDHLGDTVKIARRTGAFVFTTAELAAFLTDQGVRAEAMHIGGSRRFPFGEVKLTPAHHGGAVHGDEAGRYTCTPCGFVVRMGGKSVYHAGDTGLTMEMKLLYTFDKIDLALLPIGDNYTMGPQDAANATEMIRPRVVIPIHYNTFPAIQQDPEAFRRAISANVSAECVILQPGQTYELI